MLIAGNWKMHLLPHEGMLLTHEICEGMKDISPTTEILICPPFTHLAQCSLIIESDDIPLQLGAQNCDFHEFGAFTGEISPAMLASLGAEYVIIGHSERRTYFHESNEIIAQKCLAALQHGVTPILCIGESLEQRKQGEVEKVLSTQLHAVLNHEGVIEAIMEADIVIAYEPIWAIGTGMAADPDQAESVHSFIRSILTTILPEQSELIRIIYGGSVKPENAQAFFAKPNIDGALIGGASLKAESFLEIARLA
jgi:triosephosphate isomerase